MIHCNISYYAFFYLSTTNFFSSFLFDNIQKILFSRPTFSFPLSLSVSDYACFIYPSKPQKFFRHLSQWLFLYDFVQGENISVKSDSIYLITCLWIVMYRGSPHFCEFTIRDPRYFVILFQAFLNKKNKKIKK